MNVTLFSKVCLYDPVKEETILYGQYTLKFNRIYIEKLNFSIVFCDSRPDFYIKIKGKISNIEYIIFSYNKYNNQLKQNNIKIYYPFENCDLQLNSTSAIISTICKSYSHRLDEWIQYNLQLGFSGIVIFNNDANKKNKLHESIENCVIEYSTREVCNKYKGKVWVIDLPYSNLPGGYWTDIQRISLHIGVSAFRTKCRNIALIDADEFIHLPKNPEMKIEDYLHKYSTITMKSNILTNKSDTDILNNNILELAKYIGEDKYTKTILHTEKIRENEFIVTPHKHSSEEVLDKGEIIHYHCWMNTRYKYNESMEMINLLGAKN
jgi:hypothetical protein